MARAEFVPLSTYRELSVEEMQRAADDLQHPIRRTLRGCRFYHLCWVSAIVQIGAAHRCIRWQG